MLSRFSRNSEADASELLENLEEFYVHSDWFIMFIYSTTQRCVTCRESVKKVIYAYDICIRHMQIYTEIIYYTIIVSLRILCPCE